MAESDLIHPQSYTSKLMTDHKRLTRTCSACGIEKPISAFLHLSGSGGAVYGAICSTCRGKGIKEKAQKFVSEEERTGTTAALRIGTKELMEIELQKKLAFEKLQHEREEQAKKRDQDSSEKSESTELKEKAQKLLREKYLEDKQKQSFLNYQSKKPPTTTDALIKNSPILEEKKRALDAFQQKENIKLEQQKTGIDLSGAPVLDPQQSLISRHNPMFENFKTWLGASAPIAKTLNKTQEAATKKETPSEFIEKTWNPSSRRR